jgi:predicted CXXCH cytochrome family protein
VSGFSITPEKDGGVTLTALSAGKDRWDSDGVTCERCHGAGSEHAVAGDPWLITNPFGLDADRAADACAACHANVEGIGAALPYPYASSGTFEPGDELTDYATSVATTWSSGAADVPGEQSDEHAASPHGPGSPLELQCFDCHEPHDPAGIDASLRLDFRDNSLCLGCHLALSFGDDIDAVKDHNEHLIAYDPVGSEIGRCTGCHMPKTAARVSIGERSGAGDLPSHLFAALSPQWTLDVFDAAGVDVLPLGEFPSHACNECHAYQAWREEQIPGGVMLGATGDPTLRETHEAFLAQYLDRFP